MLKDFPSRGNEEILNLLSPADEKSSKIGSHQGGGSGKDVNCVGQQHSWLSAKAGEESLRSLRKIGLEARTHKSLVNPQRRHPTVLPIQKMVWINIGL